MKTVLALDCKSKTFCRNISYSNFREIRIALDDFRFYQKLFIVLISLSTILIFPESPRELENICESYNSRKICNVW